MKKQIITVDEWNALEHTFAHIIQQAVFLSKYQPNGFSGEGDAARNLLRHLGYKVGQREEDTK